MEIKYRVMTIDENGENIVNELFKSYFVAEVFYDKVKNEEATKEIFLDKVVFDENGEWLEDMTESLLSWVGEKRKEEDGFWRVGSVEKTKDVKEWSEAKSILGKHLVEYPTSYHWMAFGWLDKDSDFIPRESTLVEIS